MHKLYACSYVKRFFLQMLFFFGIVIGAYSQTSSGLKYPEINITYPENWIINGNNIKITRTTIYGNTLFTVHCIVSFIPNMNDDSINFAKNVARYAIEKGYLKNALLYNNYSKEINIMDDAIGIGLVYQYNINTLDEKGYAYNFKMKDLYSLVPSQNNLPSPNGFDESYPSEIKNKLLSIFNSKEYSLMYSLYSENALKTLTHKNDDKVFNFFKKIFSFTDDQSRKSILVYLGNRENKNGYLLYLPILLSPSSNSEFLVPGYFQLMIADENVNFGIYNVTVNIASLEDVALF